MSDAEEASRQAFMVSAGIVRAFPWWEYSADPAVVVKRIAEALEATAGKGKWPEPDNAKGPRE